MELTKRKYDNTCVVIEDTETVWGFDGFDANPEVLFVGTRSHCMDWIQDNPADGNAYRMISLKKYEELYEDVPEITDEEVL